MRCREAITSCCTAALSHVCHVLPFNCTLFSPICWQTLHVVPGGYHELLHGSGSEAMAQEMADWILQRSAAGGSGAAR